MEDRVAELAIMGGVPAFPEPLHVGRPFVGDRDALFDRISGVLDRNWLTNDGPLVRELEDRIATHLDVRHCIATANGTAALEVVIRALDLRGEVIVPSFTFIATAHAVRWMGLRPVFADVDPHTHSLDVAGIERCRTSATSAVLPVHLWGIPCDVEGIESWADQHGVDVVFDAAHAFSATHRGTMVGNHGRAEILSFHATKFVNTFEGGAIVTNDDGLADAVRRMRNYGFVGYDAVESVGTNAKMSEMAAAMGLTSLDAMDQVLHRNAENDERYREVLEPLGGLRVAPTTSRTERRNHQFVVLEVDELALGLTRDELLAVLWAENVRARSYFAPGIHRAEPYRTEQPEAGDGLPVTETLVETVMQLPTGPTVDGGHIERIGEIIRCASKHAAEVRVAVEATAADRRPFARPHTVTKPRR